MRRILLLLFILISSIAAQTGFTATTSHLEGKRKLKMQTYNNKYLEDVYLYDVTHYETHWDITDTTNKKISGNVIITAFPKIAGTSNVFNNIKFDLFDNMSLDSLLLTDPLNNNYKINLATSVTRLNNRVTVQIPNQLTDNQQFKLNIFYNGVPTQTGFKGFEFALRINGKSIISSLSEPENSRTWWPCKDLPKDKAPADIYIKTWPFHKAASNGLLVETITQNDKKIYHWKENYPIPAYLISVAAANYSTFSYSYLGLDGSTTMPLDYFAYPEKYTEAYEDFNITADIIHCFALRYGEYPFINEKYGMAMFPWGGAMEHQTLTSYGDNLVSGDHYYDWVVAHELGHQWLGNLVTCATWKDLWLQEGGASYMEALWADYHIGESAYLNSLADQKTSYFNEDAQSRFPIYNVPENYLWGATIYDKGSWIYHMLRYYVGDDNYFNGIKQYLHDSRWTFGAATTEQFINHLDSTSGVNLTKFKQQWIYQAGYPNYAYAKKIEGNNLYIQVAQEQSLADNTPIFSMPVLVRIQFIDNQDTVLVLNDSLQYQTFAFSFNKALKTTIFDFNYKEKVLAKKRVVAYNSINTEYIADKVDLLQNYPNPFNPETVISYQLPVESAISLKVFDSAGKEIAVLVNQKQKAGTYNLKFDGSKFSSGVYYYVIETPDAKSSKKMILIK